MLGFADIRVIDFSSDIAGPYASKLFADAGADVIKVEPAGGDPLRAWSSSGRDLAGRDGALFQFLHHGKRSVVGKPGMPEVEALLATADLAVDSAEPPLLEYRSVRARFPSLVVLSITPYGRTGPYANRPATEFTVQAESGGLAVRGFRSRPPYQAGGRIGEWVSGTFAAVAAAAAVRRARRTGAGEFIDMSMLELHNLASTVFLDLTFSLVGRPPLDGLGPARLVETPSIEPTRDGYVGFCTNSRQQFDSFLLLIDRPDLLGDEQLARHQGRVARLDEWSKIVQDWTSRHTTAEIIERASQLRIPVAPVCNGATIEDNDHFRVRGIFGDDPTGSFRMPRRPWRLNDEDPPQPRPSPRIGAQTGQIEARPPRAYGRHDPAKLPLADLRVLDLTAWWAGPSSTHMLASLGADVIHVESVQRLDGMRMTGAVVGHREKWWEYSSIFLTANANKRGLTLDLTSPAGIDVAKQLIAVSDVVVENFTPRVMANFGLDWETLRTINPRLILVRMPAFGLSGPWRDNTGFAQTMEQMTGLAWVTGYADDQPRIQRGPSDPNAGMHAAFALLVALAERDATGTGQLLEVTMIEAALNSAAEQIIEYTAYGHLLEREGNRSPTAAPQNLYACTGSERWLALSVASDQQWEALKTVLGRPPWADDPILSTHCGRRRAHDLLDERLSAWARDQDLDTAVETLVGAGVPAGRAVDPRATAFHPQLRARGFFEEIEHPVVGTHPVTGLPFRFESVDRWLRRPAPTVGQHNAEILTDLLGMSQSEVETLEAGGVIGTWPSGI